MEACPGTSLLLRRPGPSVNRKGNPFLTPTLEGVDSASRGHWKEWDSDPSWVGAGSMTAPPVENQSLQSECGGCVIQEMVHPGQPCSPAWDHYHPYRHSGGQSRLRSETVGVWAVTRRRIELYQSRCSSLHSSKWGQLCSRVFPLARGTSPAVKTR